LRRPRAPSRSAPCPESVKNHADKAKSELIGAKVRRRIRCSNVSPGAATARHVYLRIVSSTLVQVKKGPTEKNENAQCRFKTLLVIACGVCTVAEFQSLASRVPWIDNHRSARRSCAGIATWSCYFILRI
jgi:hypothetical protein